MTNDSMHGEPPPLGFLYWSVVYSGLCHSLDDVISRLTSEETSDAHLYDFRITPIFGTGSPEYIWLNGIVAGAGTKIPVDNGQVTESDTSEALMKFGTEYKQC